MTWNNPDPDYDIELPSDDEGNEWYDGPDIVYDNDPEEAEGGE